MYYFEVAVGSNKYHGKEPLTYCFEQDLKIGSLVAVPLRGPSVAGVVIKSVSKPDFATKSIERNLGISLPISSIKLLTWLMQYYPSPLGVITQQFLPANILASPRLVESASSGHPETKKVPSLTSEQSTVVKVIANSKQRSYLIHGRTGSGKTRVYLELAQQVINEGRSVIVLTPEIVLTPQLVKAFSAQFPDQVVITHSTLSATKRRSIWLDIIESNKPLVVIGPRSAIFSPLKDVGLIIMDECHEPAYKQEQSPYYQTTRLASSLANIHDAKFIMGSATPLITDYYFAEQKGLEILKMHELATKTENSEVPVKIIDLKDKAAFSRNGYLSDELLRSIETALSNKEQVLIYLNRRGTARTVLCQSCGWQALCPNCDLPLTYHGDRHELRCHTCGHRDAAINNCPVCQSNEVIFKSIGTKALAEILGSLFPKATIKRFDADTAKPDRLEAIYDQILTGQVDILVGTQMLAKGLDLPRLSVVGIVMADSSLSFPDYTAEERTFQLLYQIIGRVGRGHRAGQVVLQTFSPGNPAIQAAVAKDWELFYKTQLAQRQLFGFPPFFHLLKLSIGRASSASAQKAALALADQLEKSGLKIQVTGPAPSFYEKQAGKYRWQLIVKAKQRKELIKAIDLLPGNITYDLDPSDLL